MTCSNQNYITVGVFEKERSIPVPCGKCIPCLINKRSDWSYRLEQEYKHSKSAIFVTLTYDNKHCPDELRKIDVQLYLKRLRKKDGTNTIRYYAVGEYGTNFGRPHYHILLFNASELHARTSWVDSKGKEIGIVHIGKVTEASIAYCTKYIVQPELTDNHRQKPFSLMSRKYGIGAKYLTDVMVAWHREDDRNYIQRYGVKARLPRFYREKIWPAIKPKNGMHSEISKSWNALREQVSKKAMALTLDNQKQENDYYKNIYGDRWEQAKAESKTALLNRVKTKIKFSQTL